MEIDEFLKQGGSIKAHWQEFDTCECTLKGRNKHIAHLAELTKNSTFKRKIVKSKTKRSSCKYNLYNKNGKEILREADTKEAEDCIKDLPEDTFKISVYIELPSDERSFILPDEAEDLLNYIERDNIFQVSSGYAPFRIHYSEDKDYVIALTKIAQAFKDDDIRSMIDLNNYVANNNLPKIWRMNNRNIDYVLRGKTPSQLLRVSSAHLDYDDPYFVIQKAGNYPEQLISLDEDDCRNYVNKRMNAIMAAYTKMHHIKFDCSKLVPVGYEE